jgi:hypothetical protein
LLFLLIISSFKILSSNGVFCTAVDEPFAESPRAEDTLVLLSDAFSPFAVNALSVERNPDVGDRLSVFLAILSTLFISL